MKDIKVSVRDVSLRFRMSYEKAITASQYVRQTVRRVVDGKNIEYFTALDKVSFEVDKGDIIGVVGPNGGGKSTLLRTITGIFQPDEGVIDCHGCVSSLLSLGTGFINELSGRDNIFLNGLIIGLTYKEIEERIPQIIEFADIGKHIYKPMKYYSSGMISRLSFSIVLAMDPDILLIDEVFSVGDLAFSKKSEKAMHELLEQASCQIIVTHDLDLVMNHCNRVLYLSAGKIIVDGTPDEAISAYRKAVEP